jgi:hypothetical protein
MPERVLLDNDVVLKAASYSLVAETVAATTIDNTPPAMLGVGRFVIRNRLSRASNITDVPRATESFAQMLAAMTLVEPDDDEMAAAADLEAEAIRQDLELDGGESQLLAILANRSCSLLVTGDKRAIVAMAIVAATEAGGRVACFEQLIGHIIATSGTPFVQPRVCAEPNVDRAITNCFACSSPETPDDGNVLQGLASYIGHLERSAPGVLISGQNLLSLAA